MALGYTFRIPPVRRGVRGVIPCFLYIINSQLRTPMVGFFFFWGWGLEGLAFSYGTAERGGGLGACKRTDMVRRTKREAENLMVMIDGFFKAWVGMDFFLSSLIFTTSDFCEIVPRSETKTQPTGPAPPPVLPSPTYSMSRIHCSDQGPDEEEKGVDREAVVVRGGTLGSVFIVPLFIFFCSALP